MILKPSQIPYEPMISVVITLFNKAPYIQRALNSIFNQTHQDFEIIVIDDGSTDKGAEIVNKISDSRIHLIQQQNVGVSIALNWGIQKSTTDLIAFLDADDEWKSEYLNTILRLKDKYPKAGMYATTFEMVTKTGQKILPQSSGIPTNSWEGILPNFFRDSLPDVPFVRSSMAIYKKVINKVGGFPEDVRFGEDIDLAVRIALRYPIAFNNAAYVIYHLEDENRAGKKYHFEGNVPFYQTIKSAIADESGFKGENVDMMEFLARHQITAARHQLEIGGTVETLEILNSIRYTKKYRNQWLVLRFFAMFPNRFFKFGLSMRDLLKDH